MKLPNNEVGISDILTYRDCPARFAFQMRRHTEGSDPPEAQHPDTLYGKAVHDGIEAIEADLLTDDEAVQLCFDRWGKWLEPEDADRLRADFQTYRERDERGVILVANETEIRVPLLEHEGRTIYFRGRIDRLYQSATDPRVFIHRDYKSSKWRKSEEEVHEDKQLWAYNCGIHRYWPECQSLTQVYDQLRYGAIPTYKSGEQRAQMWEWLQRQVRAILADDTLEPSHNQWCPWCPILEDCAEIRRLSKWSLTKITELAGASGRDLPEDLEPGDLREYVEALEVIGLAVKTGERYDESVRGLLKKLPDTRVDELGYTKSKRSSNVWTPEALGAVRDTVGDERFMQLVSMTKTRVENLLEGDEKKAVLDMATKLDGGTTLRKKKS